MTATAPAMPPPCEVAPIAEYERITSGQSVATPAANPPVLASQPARLSSTSAFGHLLGRRFGSGRWVRTY